jgi:beta-N-acetylhexosaminidase
VAVAPLLGFLIVVAQWLPLSTLSSASTTTTSTSVPVNTCTAATLSQWPITQLVNQTIVVSVQANDVGKLQPAALAGYGGVLLFGTSAPKTIGATLKSLRAMVPNGLGLLVMTDEEGGGVERLTNVLGSLPWAKQMAQTLSPSAITTLAQQLGRRLINTGINVDLAPVLDVDGSSVIPGAKNPDGLRSFSGNKKVVATDGVAFMRGLQDSGALAVVKHFPGLGGASGNTDSNVAHTLPWASLQATGLFPFQWAIKNGARAIMVSNASVPGLTDVPASISTVVINEVLRQQLGFTGLVIPDSLSAGAISAQHLNVQSASVAALEAGEDMVIYGQPSAIAPSLAMAKSISVTLIHAVQSASLAKSLVVAADLQVLHAKGITSCAA